jgi:hypothetical protein
MKNVLPLSPLAGTVWAHFIHRKSFLRSRARERDWVQTDLLFAGTGLAYAEVERPNAPKKLANATGDETVTDGKMCVVQLASPKVSVDPASASTSGARP